MADHLLGHIDLAPTIVELAGGKAPEFIDGQSFAALIEEETRASFSGRTELLIENWEPLSKCEWASATLRTKDAVYTEWANGDRDFFDLRPDVDPLQLENSWADLPDSQKQNLSMRLHALRSSDSICKAGRNCAVHSEASPIAAAKENQPGKPMRGFAEASAGVDHVLLTIQGESSGRFFNGTSWQQAPSKIHANCESPGGLITFWNYPFDETESSLPAVFHERSSKERKLKTKVWAVDVHGKVSSPSLRTFAFTSPVATEN